MYRIRTFNKISPVGLNRLDPALYAVSDSETDEDAILVRSAKLLDYDFPKNLLAISRAGAGVNNIPLDRCSEAGIVVFNTPGANANAVKELVLCAMLMGSRDVDGGIQWVRQQVASGVDVTTVVEKGKAAFIGPELYKKTLGVIGLGAIGSLVANIALSLGMDVYGYDPFLSVDAALRLDRHIHVVKDINELYKRADYITIHIHYTKDTERMIDAKAIGAMKRGVRFINLARGEIVDDDAMLAALDTGWVAAYVTDFPNNRLVGAPHVHRHASPGSLHTGERAELRRHGGGRAAGLPRKRQHPQQRKPARRQPGAQRRVPAVPDPQKRARHAGQHHHPAVPGRHQCGEPEQQVPGGLRLHHRGPERPGGPVRHRRGDGAGECDPGTGHPVSAEGLPPARQPFPIDSRAENRYNGFCLFDMPL